jgi:hypothetical protein
LCKKLFERKQPVESAQMTTRQAPVVIVVALMTMASLGCERSYWVASADLRQAQAAVGKDVLAYRIALKTDQGYLRYELLRVGKLDGDTMRVTAPNKHGKRIAGAVLLGVGGALVAGGIGLVGYGVSLRRRDSVGAGIVAGLGAIPLGVGVGLAIPGIVLLVRGAGPSDVVADGDPETVYFPNR